MAVPDGIMIYIRRKGMESPFFNRLAVGMSRDVKRRRKDGGTRMRSSHGVTKGGTLFMISDNLITSYPHLMETVTQTLVYFAFSSTPKSLYVAQ